MKLSLSSLVLASSTIFLSGMDFPPRIPSQAVTTNGDSAAEILDASASAEKPANTTEWTAPILAHASIVMGSSGIMGK